VITNPLPEGAVQLSLTLFYTFTLIKEVGIEGADAQTTTIS